MATSGGFAPFKAAPISGYDFGAKVPASGWNGNGQNFGWPVHLGTDFGTPAGEPIVAPYAGKATFETGLAGYGNKLTEQFANGWELVFGHVAGGVSGQVAAGQPIGVTGHDVGSSRGAVTLVELHDPNGKAVNPDAFVKSLFAGSAKQLGGPSVPNIPAAVSTGFLDIASLERQFAQDGAAQIGTGIGLAAVAESVNAIPTQIGHGLADFFVTSEENIAEWLKRQSVAFFVAAVVLLVLFA